MILITAVKDIDNDNNSYDNIIAIIDINNNNDYYNNAILVLLMLPLMII